MDAIRKLAMTIAVVALVGLFISQSTAQAVLVQSRPNYFGSPSIYYVPAPNMAYQQGPAISTYYQPNPVRANYVSVGFNPPRPVSKPFVGVPFRAVWAAGPFPYGPP